MHDVSEAHYKMVIKEIVDGRVIPFLGAGANLCDRPPNKKWSYGQIDCLPNGSELASYLADSFGFQSNDKYISCPSCNSGINLELHYDSINNYAKGKNDLAHTSQYVAMMAGLGPLYEILRGIFDVNFPPTSLHQFLASVTKILHSKGYNTNHQLIVTTNYDDALERAFKAQHEPYDLVTYIADGEQCGKFMHQSPDNQVRIIEKPNEYLELSLMHRPVILKIHGAIDRFNADRDSYVITEDHYIDYLTRTDISNFLPTTLAAKLARSNFLFLGYSLHDWNLRAILHRIWGSRKRTWQSWAIQLRPTEFDRLFWKKKDIEILNISLGDYISELRGRVETLPNN